MQLTVLYFAALRDLTGTREQSVTIEGPLDVAGLQSHIEQLRPELAGRLGSVRIAINEEFAEPGRAINDGDVAALIPPVSGG